jgi:hypothetical protein
MAFELEFGESKAPGFELEFSERSKFERSKTTAGPGWHGKDIPLRGWEAEWENRDQEIRALLDQGIMPKGSWLFRSDVKNLVGWTPFFAALKYVFPSEQDKLQLMDEEERASAIAENTFGTLLWGALEFGGKFFGKKGAQYFKKQGMHTQSRVVRVNPATGLLDLERYTPGLQAVDEAVLGITRHGGQWEGFDLATSRQNFLKGRGFKKDEYRAIVDAATTGDPLALKVKAYDAKLSGKPLSIAWKKYVKAGAGKEHHLDGTIAQALTADTRAFKHRQLQVYKNAKARGINMSHPNKAIRGQMQVLYGEEAAKHLDIRMLTEPEAANIVANMVSPQGLRHYKRVQQLAGGQWRLPWIRPERMIFGAGEETFGTLSGIFRPIVEAKRKSMEYTVSRIQVFANKLAKGGYGEVSVDSAGRFLFKPNKEVYNHKTTKAAFDYLHGVDNLMTQARKKGTKQAYDEAATLAKDLLEGTKSASPAAIGIIDAVKSFNDLLYGEFVREFIPQVFRRYKLTQAGEDYLVGLMKKDGALNQIAKVFEGTRAQTYVDKSNAMKGFMSQLNKDLAQRGKDFFMPSGKMITHGPGKTTIGKHTADDIAKAVMDELGYGKRFPKYIQGYLPRFAEQGTRAEERWRRALNPQAAFMKGRKLPEARDRVQDLGQLMEMRIKAQAKQLHFYKDVEKAVEYARKLPPSWQKHTDFLISRATGRPSVVDEKLAQTLNFVTRGQNWDAHRVANAARGLNSLAYGGLLGFRPFSALRNLTQVFITTVPEMGPKAIPGALTGMQRATTQATRKYLKDIGIITEFLPEQQATNLLPAMKQTLLGRAGEKYMQVKDVALLMFRYSDRWNRYVSGSMALNKWDAALAKGLKGADEIADALGASKMQKWQAAELRELLRAGKVDDAKAFFVRETVADTQYLYGSLDAPAMLGSGGAIKSMTQFQSWWMNYGSLLGKWAETGVLPEKAGRALTAFATAASVEMYMDQVYGTRIAQKTAGAGPLPLDPRSAIPPMIQPGIEITKALSEVLKPGTLAALRQVGYQGAEDIDWERVFGHVAKAGEDTATMMVPGGLQMKQLYRGYQDDDIKGALKALGNIK